MTSNIASQVIQDFGESERATMITQVEAELKRYFRPELLNRVDEVLVFHRLSEEHMKAIVHIQLGRLNRLLEDRRIRVEATEAAVELLARKGYDPDFGARPLKRAIQRLVQDPLANKVLVGGVGDGDAVLIEAEGGGVVLTVK